MGTHGGHAFPHEHGNDRSRGMTLRDWFAGLAMQGIVTLHPNEDLPMKAAIAMAAYAIADAMLKERDGPAVGRAPDHMLPEHMRGKT